MRCSALEKIPASQIAPDGSLLWPNGKPMLNAAGELIDPDGKALFDADGHLANPAQFTSRHHGRRELSEPPLGFIHDRDPATP